MAKEKPNKGEKEIEVDIHYPEPLVPTAVNHISMSRVAGEVQLDLACINLQELVLAMRREDKRVKVDADVAFSCILTPSAFLRLHQDVNTFYATFIEAGVIREPHE